MRVANVEPLEVATAGPAWPELSTTACCGGPPQADAEACCAKDELAKQAGELGCGCGPAVEKVVAKKSCCGTAT